MSSLKFHTPLDISPNCFNSYECYSIMYTAGEQGFATLSFLFFREGTGYDPGRLGTILKNFSRFPPASVYRTHPPAHSAPHTAPALSGERSPALLRPH